eukprot:m.110142 g.110142  ORF g.110142 m.110142 type:complete len:54 (+) comp13386_c0_seq7:2417-2578(+)
MFKVNGHKSVWATTIHTFLMFAARSFRAAASAVVLRAPTRRPPARTVLVAPAI